MKNLSSLYYSLFIFLLCSCGSSNNKQEEVVRVTLKPEIINDAVITKFPGILLVNDKYAVLENPFLSDFFMQIFDINTGKELAKSGKLGRGPSEFITPALGYIKEDSIYVFDLNKDNHAGLLSIKSAISGNHEFDALQNVNNHGATRVAMIDNNTNVFYEAENDEFFTLIENGLREVSFGVNPIKTKINNYRVFQGDISYNSKKEIFVHTVKAFPYIAIYKKDARKGFILQTEVGEQNPGEIIDEELVLNNKKAGIFSSVLALDYIICHQRDYSVDNTDESTVGRDFSKIPQTVFLYDYDGKLKKIIDLSYPVIRIAANPDSNELYAVILNEEFQIVKYSL